MARYLVTGGCGSIGSVLVLRLLQSGHVVCSFDNCEDKLFTQIQSLPAAFTDRHKAFVGDVRDAGRLRQACAGVDYVFHCAALKHLDLCEYNPFEALKTNVQGTNNVIQASISAGVRGVVFASSDKAVNPTSTMGASKLLAERVVISAKSHTGVGELKTSCVRFGNVWNTAGSVGKIFSRQSRSGLPLTVTSSDMTRFFITVEKAIALCEYAMNRMMGGEVFIANMGALNIAHLAEEFNRQHQNSHAISFANPRPGEKLYEELFTSSEASRTGICDDYYVVLPEGLHFAETVDYWKAKDNFRMVPNSMSTLRSDDPSLLTTIDPASLIRMIEESS